MSDTRKTTKPNVPNLRFPGFEGEWELHLLSDYCHKITRKNKGNVLSNVLSNSANRGIISQSEYFDRAIANSNNTAGYYIIEQDDFVYNPRKSTAAPYGPVNVYHGGEPGIISPLYLCFKTTGINREFLSYYFKSKAWWSYMYENGDSGVRHDRVSIKDDVFFAMPIQLPPEKEQLKIAQLLSLIDQHIAVQNKVIEKYESLIKALYKQLIPDRDDHAALGTLVRICKGKQLNGEFLSEDGKYYVMNGGITPSGYYDDYNTPAGTISISEGGNSCGFVQYNEKPFWSGGHCYTLLQTTDERVQYKFLYHLLKSKQDDIMALRIGSGLPNIQKKDIGRFPIPMLPLEHQKAITRLLDSVYKHIEYEQALLAELVHLKSYFLGALFI